MTFSEVERALREALTRPLPGLEAQRTLAPMPRTPRPPTGASNHREAAALLLLYPSPDAHLVLTVRHDALPQHGGQVSLPGGRVEPGESFRETALREAAEEIGLDPARVRLLGELTPIEINVSRFLLHPVVGITDGRPPLRPSQGEVARILEVRLDDLRDPARFHREVRERGGADFFIPYFHVAGEQVWGATAMVLAELLWLLGWRPQQPS
jgi:8-oxo-dGTP pyrophosphatase MutT (NUDIX family)